MNINLITVNNITYSQTNLDCLPPDLSLEGANVVKVKGGYVQNNWIEATLDPFWGARAVPSSKPIKNGSWMGANMLGKILRRELGLPNQPMEVSNTQPDAAATATLPLTAAANDVAQHSNPMVNKAPHI